MSPELRELIGEYLWCGVAYSRDEGLRGRATAGGLVTSLLIATLRRKRGEGALVVENEGLEQKVRVTGDEGEIISAMGSKYLQIPLNAALRELLQMDGRFIFVGLPCHLKGLKKLESINPGLRERIILKIGLFCGHAVSRDGMGFLLNALGIRPEEIAELSYRKKMHGTTGLYVKTQGGFEVFIPSSKYWRLFFNLFFIPWGCLYCEDMTAEHSDISVGDAWGFEGAGYPGLSLFIVRSRRGERAIKDALSEGLIEVERVDPRDVVRSQRYLMVKKRRMMRGLGRAVGYAYHVAQVVGASLSESRWAQPLLRVWLTLLLHRERGRTFIHNPG